MLIPLLLVAIPAVPLWALDFPGPAPGKALGNVALSELRLENDAIACAWAIREGRLKPLRATDKISGITVPFDPERSEAFRLTLGDGTELKASDLKVMDDPRIEDLAGDASAACLAKRLSGKRLLVPLVHPDTGLEVDWRAELRDGSNYVRPEVALRATSGPVTVQKLDLVDLAVKCDATPRVAGTVQGSPLVLGNMFFAYEHANSDSGQIPSNPPGNLAFRKPVSASGQFGNLAPERATDGNFERDLHWGCQNVPVWLQVDLGQAEEIACVRLFTWHNNSRVYQYRIESSLDGAAWQPAVDRTANTSAATTDGYDDPFEPRRARYVRATITGNSEGGGLGGHIVELQVLGPRTAPAEEEPEKRLRCGLTRNAAVRPGQETVQSSVIGVVPEGQLRRGFLYYVERERAHPYRPHLHYNSWYDLFWAGLAPDEAQCLEAIELFGRELVAKRGVPLECFVWDDGWDDPKTLWKFDKQRFPNGFRKMNEAARKYNSAMGVWMSPFGGYGEPRAQRIAYGREQGFEIENDAFLISGPKYFERFQETSLDMIREQSTIHFKYDGMNASRIEEMEAMLRLIGALRKARPTLYINMTVGSWPSPFYLWLGDSIWRGGGDMDWCGLGSKRQQWINYRDRETYQRVVRGGPLYPLNAVMTQGIAHARHGYPAENGNSADELRDEIRSFFGSGTQLQELYITPQMMSERNWDDLAEAAKWSRANSDALVDTHWIGGDPGADEVYGWAAWAPRTGILTLRNPSDRPSSITLDVGEAFELPAGAAQRFALQSPWKEDADKPSLTLEAGKPHAFNLGPFEVLVLDANALAAGTAKAGGEER